MVLGKGNYKDEKHLRFRIWCDLYQWFDSNHKIDSYVQWPDNEKLELSVCIVWQIEYSSDCFLPGNINIFDIVIRSCQSWPHNRTTVRLKQCTCNISLSISVNYICVYSDDPATLLRLSNIVIIRHFCGQNLPPVSTHPSQIAKFMGCFQWMG